MGKENGTLVISLDFELLWGIFDKVDWRNRQQYFINTRKVIPKILEVFEKNQIACTWATVGMLFNENWEEWRENIPKEVPAYVNQYLSAYKYGNQNAEESTEKYCFAPDIIKQIAATPRQEIGTHTYSHYYCLEEGQGAEAFRFDLNQAIYMGERFDIKLESLVFPRNQFNQDYIKICSEMGITSLRTNPSNWYWQNTQKDSIQQKIFRTGDAYIGRPDKSYPVMEITRLDGDTFGHKASRLYRPYSDNVLLNKWRLKRIISEMTYAAKHREIYHLWWHPHNFGQHPEENMRDLNSILEHYQWCHSEYGFNSLNMKGLNALVNE